ncbi:MAG TPA: helix-turn-helix domain-containing protein [Microthrixaceae bacterium]|nr:helix-turn-helix domain-containing protein [Microthrixaceae bacterium]
MTTLQEQARALGDPTRHRIFRYIVDADRAVDVAELTEHFGLNHNAVRQHLAKLTAADLLVSGTVPSKGRGRPRLCYRVAPAVEARWGVESPYERLSTLLVEMLRSGEAAEEVGRRAGVRSDPDAAADPIETLVEEMARHGFDPVVTRDGDEVEVTLRSCPFASAAVRDPGTVCGIHLGIARGVADLVGGMVVDELVPHDPRRAGCRLRVHLEARE